LKIAAIARGGISDHHRLESCLSAALFLGLFVYLWKGIELHLLYSGFGVFTAYPVVSWEGSFWRATFRTAGGPVRALAALLAQSYSRSWLGATTVTILLGLFWLGIRHLLRRGRAGRFRDLAWVPLLLALMIYSDYYEDPLPVLLTVGLAVWTAILYERMSEKPVPRGVGLGPPTQNSALGGPFQPMNHRQDADATKARGRAGLFLVLVGGLYYLAGAAALVFAAIACLIEAFLQRKTAAALVQMVLAVGGVFVLGRFVFGLEPLAIYAAGTPWDADKPLKFFPVANWLALALHFFVPGLMLVALVGETLLAVDAQRGARRGRGKEGRQPVREVRQTRRWRGGPRASVVLRLGAVAVAAGLCLIVSRTQAHDERALHYYAQQRDWDRVLALAHRMRGKHQFTRSGVFDINRALAHTGRLGSELFAYPQDDLKTLYMRFDDMSGRLTRAKSLELYLDLGCLNAAQENAYELLAHEGPSPPVLDALVRIHLAKGQYETARIFLQALRKYAGGRRYVRRWQPLAADPARAEADPLLASWRRARPTRDDTSLGISPAALRNLLEDKPDHRLAFEYLMACMLLRNERGELIRRLPLLKALGYTQLPRHYAEAVLVQSLKTRTPPETSGWTIDPDVQRQFGEIRRIVTESRGSDQMLFDTLAPRYGDTYMFYSMFSLCGLK
jgi:hypothetical protein